MSRLKQWLNTYVDTDLGMGLASQLPAAPANPTFPSGVGTIQGPGQQLNAATLNNMANNIAAINAISGGPVLSSAAWAAASSNAWAQQQQLNNILFTVDPVHVMMQRKLLELSVRLPVRLTTQIKRIALIEEPLRIEVVYANGYTLVIHDVDAFPSEADIARIALECP